MMGRRRLRLSRRTCVRVGLASAAESLTCVRACDTYVRAYGTVRSCVVVRACGCTCVRLGLFSADVRVCVCDTRFVRQNEGNTLGSLSCVRASVFGSAYVRAKGACMNGSD